jgi:O-methyltransferase
MRLTWRARLRVWLRCLAFYTPFRRFIFPRYQYAFSPRQLATLLDMLDEVRQVPGDYLEIGCFVGATTIFLNRHVQVMGDVRPYYALDTFTGFTAPDVAHETQQRGKAELPQAAERALFVMNDQRWFDYTMRLNQITNVRSIAGDVKNIDLNTFTQRVCFVLLDVDLYIPTKQALDNIWPLLADGGVIVIDDCAPGQVFDGARQAWEEFVREKSLARELRDEKLAIIRKAKNA